MIQSLTVRDATGALGAAAGTEAGMILTPWNPDESWTHDALVQVGILPHFEYAVKTTDSGFSQAEFDGFLKAEIVSMGGQTT